MSANVITKAPKQFFTSTMNYYSRLTDSDLEWLVVNNEANFKLGTDDIAIDDTATVTISSSNQALIRAVWFLAPFDMTVTNVTGIVQDDDFSTNANMFYIGIWVMAGFGAPLASPGEETGSKTLALKYVTPDYSSGTAEDAAMGFYHTTNNIIPPFSLSAGDAVWAGHLNKRFDGVDDMTLTMTLCAEKD